MGKRLKDIYPHATKWQVFKYRLRKFIRKVFIFSLIALTLYGVYKLGNVTSKNVVYETQEVIVQTDTLTPKVNELKKELVEEIKSCESQGYNEDFGLLTYDPHKTNKKVESPSIGLLQFKKSTVQYYYKTLYNKEITGKEAILIALDEELATQLASDIIFQTDKGLSDWYICTKKLNSRSKLNIINSITG